MTQDVLKKHINELTNATNQFAIDIELQHTNARIIDYSLDDTIYDNEVKERFKAHYVFDDNIKRVKPNKSDYLIKKDSGIGEEIIYHYFSKNHGEDKYDEEKYKKDLDEYNRHCKKVYDEQTVSHYTISLHDFVTNADGQLARWMLIATASDDDIYLMNGKVLKVLKQINKPSQLKMSIKASSIIDGIKYEIELCYFNAVSIAKAEGIPCCAVVKRV